MFGQKKRARRGGRKVRSPLFTQLWVGLTVFFVLFLLGSILWYGTRLESLTITDVRVAGGETIDHAAVRAVVEEELEGEYYRFVPRRFAWTYPEQKILTRVGELPRVSAVYLDTSESNTLNIYLQEYQPFALWCAGVGATCVFVDQEGQAFATAPTLIGTSLLRYQNGNQPAVGTKPFGPVSLKETSRFAFEVHERFGFSVMSVEWVGQEEISYHLRGGGILKTTLRQPIDDTLDNLTVILAAKQFAHITPGNFSYIDLRFGEKVFVNEGNSIEDETDETSVINKNSAAPEAGAAE